MPKLYYVLWRYSCAYPWLVYGTERKLDTYRGMRAATRRAHRLEKLRKVQARVVLA